MLLKTVWIHSICQAHQGTLVHVSSSLHHPVVLHPSTGLLPQPGRLFQTPQASGKKTPKPTTKKPPQLLYWVAFTILDCKEHHLFLQQQDYNSAYKRGWKG